EDDQEDQREDEREEQGGPVPAEPAEHRPGKAEQLRHARYSRPVRLRKTSSRDAPRTASPRRALRSASSESTAAELRVEMVNEIPSSLTSASGNSRRTSSTGRVPASTPIRVGASNPRTSEAGGPSWRILPSSMMATRSQSSSASSR